MQALAQGTLQTAWCFADASPYPPSPQPLGPPAPLLLPPSPFPGTLCLAAWALTCWRSPGSLPADISLSPPRAEEVTEALTGPGGWSPGQMQRSSWVPCRPQGNVPGTCLGSPGGKTATELYRSPTPRPLLPQGTSALCGVERVRPGSQGHAW